MMKRFAVIVAGGKGVRMGNPTPKQFLEVAEKPILMHTLAAFAACQPAVELVLVLPKIQLSTWKELCAIYGFKIAHRTAIGGNTRTESVHNGLNSISEEGLVAIHDGVRPLVSTELIDTAFEVATTKGSAIAAVPLKDSIRQIEADGKSTAKDRNRYQLVQTPQTFQLHLIKEAYRLALANPNATYTDDASVFEAAGKQVYLVEGSYQNIKITTPEDLLFAEAYLT